MSGAIVERTEEGTTLPSSSRPPTSQAQPKTGPAVWLRHNLFRSPVDAVVTLVSAVIAIWVLYKTINFIFVTGRWEIIRRNENLMLLGRFPAVHVLRWSVTAVTLSAWAGLIAGILRARQIATGKIEPDPPFSAKRIADLVGRFWIPAATLLLTLALASSSGPWITAALSILAAIAGRLIGPFIGRIKLGAAANAALYTVLAAVPIVLFFYLENADDGIDIWGGFALNLFLALVSIILCFPLGVLLALGRRGKLPLVRLLSTAYIEIARGAPLFVLLLLANTALQFFVPESLAPSKPTRSIVVFTLFTAAYMAEIVRGGLQSVPTGQSEAAKALGLSPVRQTGLVVLPQALRNVIPAQIGQLISLFKDTTLAGIAMGLFDMLNVAEAVTSQEDFQGLGLIGETLAFTGLLFWAVSYTMSRESQRLEKRLGVGVR